jgi:ATP synthase protein I
LILVFLRDISQPAFGPEERVPKIPESLRKAGPYLNIGGTLAGCVAIGSLGGHWLDVKLETEPWLLLSGSLLGIVAGFYHFFKVVLQWGRGKKHE